MIELETPFNIIGPQICVIVVLLIAAAAVFIL